MTFMIGMYTGIVIGTVFTIGLGNLQAWCQRHVK